MDEIHEIISKPMPVDLKDLHIRYIPKVTPLHLWHDDMSLKNSPHVELMEIFNAHGCKWEIIKNSRYYAERKYRHEIGMKRWTTEKIYSHIKARYKIFKSIKKHGYDPKIDRANPIKVLRKPFWETRFNVFLPLLNGPEIWNGAGRASAAYVLGYKRIKAMWCADAHPHTKEKGKFASKLRDVEGVWAS